MSKPVISDAAKVEAFEFNFSGLEAAEASKEQILAWFNQMQTAYYLYDTDESAHAHAWAEVSRDLMLNGVNPDCGVDMLVDAFDQTEALAIRFDVFKAKA